MATNILMPALSPTMTEGTLSRWLKREGEQVRAGDVIAEIETDKATMEVEAVDEGVLGKILVADGTEGVKVNEPIAILVDQGEAVPVAPAVNQKAAPAPAAREAPPTPRSRTPAPQQAAPPQTVAPKPALSSGNGHNGGIERIFASPLARRMAEPIARAAGGPFAPHRLVPHSSIRKVIARRLTEAKSSIPHFYVSMDVEIDALIRLLSDLNAKSPKDGSDTYLVTINDMVIKASAATLRRVPTV